MFKKNIKREGGIERGGCGWGGGLCGGFGGRVSESVFIYKFR